MHGCNLPVNRVEEAEVANWSCEQHKSPRPSNLSTGEKWTEVIKILFLLCKFLLFFVCMSANIGHVSWSGYSCSVMWVKCSQYQNFFGKAVSVYHFVDKLFLDKGKNHRESKERKFEQFRKCCQMLPFLIHYFKMCIEIGMFRETPPSTTHL